MLHNSTEGLNNFRAIVEIPEIGVLLSAHQYSVLHPQLDSYKILRMGRIRSIVNFNGKTYCGGYFEFQSYERVDNFGEIMPGDNVSHLKTAGIDAYISDLGDFIIPYPYPFALHKPLGFEAPAGSNNGSIYYSSIFAVASHSEYGTHISPTKFPTFSMEGDLLNNSFFMPGPWCDNAGLNYRNQNYQVYFADTEIINNHVENWNTSGYVPHSDITNWKGNGNTENGESNILAPYFDSSGDGIYNPMQGDSPTIKGDAMIHTNSPFKPELNI